MGFERTIKASEVPEGGLARATVKNLEVVIIQRNGVFYALDGICTHAGGPLCEGTIDGEELVCPWHEGRFDIRTGKANPDTSWAVDTERYSVKVEDGYVWIEV